MSDVVTEDEDGIRLAVRVTPRAGREGFAGLVEGTDGCLSLAVRLASRPVDGAANKALVALLARELGVPRSAVRILSGAQSRRKQVRIHGLDAARFSRWLETVSG